MKLHITTIVPEEFTKHGDHKRTISLPRHEVMIEFAHTGSGADFLDEIQLMINHLEEAKLHRMRDINLGFLAIRVPLPVESISTTQKHE